MVLHVMVKQYQVCTYKEEGRQDPDRRCVITKRQDSDRRCVLTKRQDPDRRCVLTKKRQDPDRRCVLTKKRAGRTPDTYSHLLIHWTR